MNTLDPDTLTQIGLGGAIGTGILMWVIRTAIRRFSRDKVELAKDRIELDVYDALKADNERKEALILRLENRLDQLSAERNEAVSRVGALTTEVENLRQQVISMRGHITSLEDQIALQTAMITNQQSLIKDFMHRLNFDPVADESTTREHGKL
jgi:chromosome segregation ATPase